MSRLTKGVGRRDFIAGAAACGGLLLLEKTCYSKSHGDKSQLTGSMYHRVCTFGKGRVFVSASRISGAHSIDHFLWKSNGLQLVSSYVSTGSGRGQLNYPLGLTCNDDGELFVLDSNNGRIQVFEVNEKGSLTFLRSFCQLGPKPGHLHTPQGISSQGDKVYVADTRNHRIQVLRQDNGRVLEIIGEHGDGLGQFSLPTDIVLGDDGTIFVNDRGNSRVHVVKPTTPSTSNRREFDVFPTPIQEDDPKKEQGFSLPLTSLDYRNGSVYVMESNANSKASKVDSNIYIYRSLDGSEWKLQRDYSKRLTKKIKDMVHAPHSFALYPGGGLCVADHRSGLLTYIEEG